MKGPRRVITDEEVEQIVALRETAGLSYARIAQRIGCSRGTVAWRCLVLGADPPKPCPVGRARGPEVFRRGAHEVRRFSPAEDARMLALEADGQNYNQIARALGRQRNSIEGRLATLARIEQRQEDERAAA